MSTYCSEALLQKPRVYNLRQQFGKGRGTYLRAEIYGKHTRGNPTESVGWSERPSWGGQGRTWELSRAASAALAVASAALPLPLLSASCAAVDAASAASSAALTACRRQRAQHVSYDLAACSQPKSSLPAPEPEYAEGADRDCNTAIQYVETS